MTTVISRVRLSFGRLAKLTAPALLAIGLFAFGTGGASAVPTSCPGTDNNAADREFQLTPTDGSASCFYSAAGNLESINPKPAWYSQYTLLDKSDDNVPGGPLTITGIDALTGSYSIVASGYSSLLLLLKSGEGQLNPDYAVFELLNGALSGTWAILNGNQSLSHASLYGIPAAVPVPAGIALGAAGLGVLGFMGWRKKRSVAA